MKHNKKRRDGKDERRRILEPIFGNKYLHDALYHKEKLASSEDDILDAFAALWTAERIALGKSFSIPNDPPRDSYELPMQIVV